MKSVFVGNLNFDTTEGDDREVAQAMAGLDGREVAGRALRLNEASPALERSRPRANFSGPGAL
jgi:hypothetical protein